MRIGIVSNDDNQVLNLLTALAGNDILWVAGPGLAEEYGYPVYQDYTEAMAANPVDLIIADNGNVQVLGAMVVEATAALYLLSPGRGSDIPLLPVAGVSDSVGQLAAGINKIVQEIGALTNYTRKLAEAGSQLDTASRGILEDLGRTARILDSLARIAKRSKIIGLNSAIEAARVGEMGRGFAVVAEEIKSLADDSSQSVRDIERILENIQRRSDELSARTEVIKDVSELQQETTEKVSALLQALKELGQHLYRLADNQPA